MSLHYLHAPELRIDGGGWMPPDDADAQSVSLGGYDGSIVRDRPGKVRSFQLIIDNPSSVSQTILGMTDAANLGNPKLTEEPEHLLVTTTSGMDAETLRFTDKPVVIPPNGSYTLELSQRTAPAALWGTGCHSESWDSLSLRVRVGMFTRTENVSFGSMILEIRGPGTDC